MCGRLNGADPETTRDGALLRLAERLVRAVGDLGVRILVFAFALGDRSP
jgi:hypothetical protein